MSSNSRPQANTWKYWPLVAFLIAGGFILLDLLLVNDTSRIKAKATDDINLIEELSKVDAAIIGLNEAHQNKEKIRNDGSWAKARHEIRKQLVNLEVDHPEDKNVQELVPKLYQVLHQTDSLHKEARRHPIGSEGRQRADAVLSVVTGRSSFITGQTAERIRKDRLDENIAQLTNRWNSVQIMLIIACLFAMVLAWVIMRNRKLLDENILKSSELLSAKSELEETNKELRETMLSKEEKEVMIKEIHHRVKNNLQIVKSLIRFQMYSVEDEDIHEKFNECVNRVAAMALVHEQTYLSKDLANIDVNEYLDQLTKDLISAYNIDLPIDMKVEIEVPTLTVDTLVPLGLLMNEIISNTFKHAFQGRDKGCIMVQIKGSELYGLDVRIGDDGVGLPDRSQWNNHQSLGMDLIHTLTEQLDGNIELLDGPGTVYHLRTKGAEIQDLQRA